MKIICGAGLALVMSLVLVSPATAHGSPAKPATVAYHLRGAVRHLVVHPQTHAASYDRDKDFGDWIDQGGGCDTRAVVLKEESFVPVTQNADCTVETGKWLSYYDSGSYSDAGDLQIDHVVPVENVWVSGGWRWTQATRVAYYNDLADPRTLVAVDSHDNEAKGDQTPDQWLPPRHDCRYITQFVSIKLRWGLTVTAAEQDALTSQALACRNVAVSYTPAPIIRLR